VDGICNNGLICFSGSKLNSGIYGKRFLDNILNSHPVGSTVSMSVAANQYANRFEVRDGNNNLLVSSVNPLSSNWLGAPTECILPTGSMNNSQSTATLTFVKPSGSGVYMRVETCVPSGMYDSWQACVRCFGAIDPCTTLANTTIDGYNQSGFKIFNKTVSLAGIAAGTKICLTANCSEVPNQFEFKYNNVVVNNWANSWLGSQGAPTGTCQFSPVTGMVSNSSDFIKIQGVDEILVKVTSCPPSGIGDSWFVTARCCAYPDGGE
jgi:hypothetical protein